jgi:hypothetical protein
VRELEDLWDHYCDCMRPPDVGSVGGVRLGELDDEISALVGMYLGGPESMAAPRVARLGLALADLTRVLPTIEPEAARRYFQMVESVGRAALVAIRMREPHDC